MASILSQDKVYFRPHEPFLFLYLYPSSPISQLFLHDDYIAAIENCWTPMVVKHTLFAIHVASLLLGASFNTIFAAVHSIIVVRRLALFSMKL